MPEFFVTMGYIRFCSSCFSKPTGLVSSFKVPIKSFLLVLKCSVKNHWFFPCSGILMDQKCQEMLLVLKCQHKLIFLQIYLLRFSIKVSMHTLLAEADFSFPNIMNNLLYVEIGVLIDQKLPN